MSVKSEHPDRPSEMMVGGVCEIHPDICLFFGRRFRSVAPQSWREGFERCRCTLFVSNACWLTQAGPVYYKDEKAVGVF